MSGWSEGFNAATMAKQSDSRSKLAWAELAAVEEEKLKRESDAGKAAEYFFKANPEAMAATGISEQQFANMSAREQSQAAMGFVQSQATKKIMQELADQKATQTANSAFGRDMSGVYGRNTMQTLAQGNGPVNPPAVGMDQLAAGLSPEAWQSPQAQTLLRELAQQRPLDPLDKFKSETERMRAEAYRRQVEQMGQGGAGSQLPPEKPTVRVTTKDAAGNSITSSLTESQFQERKAKQNAPTIKNLMTERNEHLRKIAAGDKRAGFANYKSRQERIQEIDAELAGLGAVPEEEATPSGDPAVKPQRYKLINGELQLVN